MEKKCECRSFKKIAAAKKLFENYVFGKKKEISLLAIEAFKHLVSKINQCPIREHQWQVYELDALLTEVEIKKRSGVSLKLNFA